MTEYKSTNPKSAATATNIETSVQLQTNVFQDGGGGTDKLEASINQWVSLRWVRPLIYSPTISQFVSVCRLSYHPMVVLAPWGHHSRTN